MRSVPSLPKFSCHRICERRSNDGSVKVLLAARGVFSVSTDSGSTLLHARYLRLPPVKRTNRSTKRIEPFMANLPVCSVFGLFPNPHFNEDARTKGTTSTRICRIQISEP